MADVFSIDANAPIASTSRVSLDSQSVGGGGEDGLPTLAQLLQDTVARAAAGSSSKASSRTVQDAVPLPSLASLPNLSTPSARAYIGSLLSKDLPSLLKEPAELTRQSDALDADLANLCFRSTGDLLGVGDCVDGVEDGFGQMQSTLDSLLACTEQLSSSCSTFTSSTTPILSSRSRLALVRSHIASIEDVLSIPRLVSTCVRGGWWTEAMELAYRARDLEQILKPSSKAMPEAAKPSRRDLLGKVKEEVDVEVRTLRARIIEGLRGRGLKLPSAVRSIGLLRRMAQSGPVASLADGADDTGALSEAELRLTFLASRWDCLRSQLEQIEVSASAGGSSEDRMRYLKRWVEVWREVVGDTVGIYSEIFLSSSSTGESDPQAASSSPELQDPHTPLPIFLSQCLHALRRLLETQLPQISNIASLASLQTQLSYCSAAFSKFGFEFRHLPNALISARVQAVTEERFAAATAAFAKDIHRALTLSGARGGKARFAPGALIGDDDARSSILTLDGADLPPLPTSKKGKSAQTRQWQTSQPPNYITLFPPLARLLNGHAQALNELRLLPLAALYPALRAQQAAALASCAEELSTIASKAQQALNNAQWSPNPDATFQQEQEEQQAILKKLVLVLTRAVIPWCIWALREGVYPDIEEDQGAEDRIQAAVSSLLQVVGIQEDQGPEEAVQTNGDAHAEEASEIEDAAANTPEPKPEVESAEESKVLNGNTSPKMPDDEGKVEEEAALAPAVESVGQ